MTYTNDEIVHLASRLIAIRSTADDASSLRRVIAEAMKPLSGYTVHTFERNDRPSVLVANRTERTERFRVIINAHLDVVPAPDASFTPVIDGDRLYGRGALDMKGAAAASIVVFARMARQLPYPVGLQLVTDEEIGGFDGTKYQVEEGVTSHAIVSGEPTQEAILTEGKGVLWVRLTASGRSAHAAFPWFGSNAIELVTDAVRRIRRVYPNPKRERWATTANLARIETPNTALNKVPDRASAFLDIRYVPNESETVIDTIRAAAGPAVTIDVLEHEPAHSVDRRMADIVSFGHAAKRVTGRKPTIGRQHWASDVRFYRPPMVGFTYGPTGEGMHAETEWVSIASLMRYAETLGDWLSRLNGQDMSEGAI